MWKETIEAIGKVIALTRGLEDCKADIKDIRREINEIRQELRNTQTDVRQLSNQIENFMYRATSEHEKLLLRLEVAMLKMERRLPPADETKVIE
jgi:peptidoglycan hydrolase CwlO-like protein